MRLALVFFFSTVLCVFVYVFYFIATMSFAGYFLSVLLCLLSMLISDSRFDLVWFRLSCDHGWIRSGSVNVRKQQQLCTSSSTAAVCSRVASSSFILFSYLYWYSYIVYFVCDSASEFGAMGSTSFLGFSYPNLLLVFLKDLLLLGTCIILFSQVLGLSLGLFYFYRYFCVPYFGLACDHGNEKFVSLP